MEIGSESVGKRLFSVDDQGRARALLAVAAPERAPGYLRAFLPARMDPETTFRKIVHVWRSAFDAERAGAYTRADFYWPELRYLVESHGAADPCWISGKKLVLGSDSKVTAEEFSRAFRSEVVLWDHVGLFRGQVARGMDVFERPKFHLGEIARLLSKDQDSTTESQSALIDTLAVESATRMNPENRELFWKLLMDLFPSQSKYADAAVAAIYNRTMKHAGEVAESEKQRVLHAAIREVDKISRRFPENHLAYDLLALLYHEDVYVSSSVPQAWLALRKAETFGGEQPAFANTREQLTNALSVLKQRADRLTQALWQQPGFQLTAEGQKLVADASTGTELADRWQTSSEAAAIRTNRDRATRAQRKPFGGVDPASLPMFTVDPAGSREDSEPFVDWFHSRQARRLRLEMIAACALIVITGGILLHEAVGTGMRHRAWERAQTAVRSGTDTAVLDALNDYFEALPPRHADISESEAARLYTTAVTRWLTSRGTHSLSAEERTRLNRYKRQVLKFSTVDSTQER